MIVAFEGLDGVGKSTISNKFCNEFGFKYVERPLYSLFEIERENSLEHKIACKLENKVYNETKSSELKSCLTALGLIYIHKARNNENLVLDRALLSNFSYNGTEQSLPLFEALLNMSVYPDITFLLYASEPTRRNRIIKRNPFDPDLTDPEVTTQTYEKLFDFIKKYNLPVVIINTENKTPDEVYCEVVQKYKEILENGNTKSSRQYRLNK